MPPRSTATHTGRTWKESSPALEATRYFRIGNVYHQPEKQGRFSAYPSWPNGVAACVVEVDPETGFVEILRFCMVHDAGTIVNPLLAEANLHGGIAQGIGAALYEQIAYDEAGQLLTATFMDYTIPTAVEVPDLEIGHQETPTPFTPLGTKGVGESGVGAPLGALCSAIENALPELDIRLTELPLTPGRVWEAIQRGPDEARGRRDGDRLMLAKEFEFHAPEEVDAALDLLGNGGGIVKVLAGGMSLVPAMNLGLVRPDTVLSLNHVRGLDHVEDRGDTVAFGAMVRHERIAGDPLIRSAFPLLAAAAEVIGDVQIRHRGTLGGSLAHADPAADYLPVMTVLGATMRLRSREGERAVPARDFFVDIMLTDLAPDELLVEVEVPKLPDGCALRLRPACPGRGQLRDRERRGRRRRRQGGHRDRGGDRRPGAGRAGRRSVGRPLGRGARGDRRLGLRGEPTKPSATSTRRPSTDESWRVSSPGAPSRRRSVNATEGPNSAHARFR